MQQVLLNNGTAMPSPGLGVFRVEDDKIAYETVLSALEAGYRHIDTAAFYRNESAVGRAVRDSGIPRAEIFVTTKLWDDIQLKGLWRDAFQRSLEALNIGYVDLYLVHWPLNDLVERTWTAMEEFYQSSLTKAIGVSNHRVGDLCRIRALGGTVPAVNQVECHPYFPQQEMLHYCKENGIVMQAWAPLGAQKAPLLEEPVLAGLAGKHGKSPAQIVLRWSLQLGVVPLPKSQNPQRQRENLQLFDFSLDEEDMERMGSLDSGKRLSFDPEERAGRTLADYR